MKTYERPDKYRNATYKTNPDGSITWILVKPKKNSKHYRGDISDIRKAIFDRDGNKCYYCSSTHRLSLDHVMPKPIFQWHDPYNLITACWDCNRKKHIKILLDPLLSDVLAYIKKANKVFDSVTIADYTRRLTMYWMRTGDNRL